MTTVKEMMQKVNEKTKNIKMNYDNMMELLDFENEVISMYREWGQNYIIDDNKKVIHIDPHIADPYTDSYKEYVETFYMNLCAPGATIHKKDGGTMTDEEFRTIVASKLDELELEYGDDLFQPNEEYLLLNTKVEDMKMDLPNHMIATIIDQTTEWAIENSECRKEYINDHLLGMGYLDKIYDMIMKEVITNVNKKMSTLDILKIQETIKIKENEHLIINDYMPFDASSIVIEDDKVIVYDDKNFHMGIIPIECIKSIEINKNDE